MGLAYMTGYFILGMTYAFAAAVQPGPLQAYLISQTLTIGLRRALPAAFAPLISDGPIILLVLIFLIQMPGWFVRLLQYAGGVFLLILAYGALKTWRNFNSFNPTSVRSGQQTLIKAVMVNLLNPAPYLGWSLVMGPLLLKGWRETPMNGISLLMGFYLTLIIVTLGIMLIFTAARPLGSRVNRALIGLSAIALTLFGLYEIYQGIRISLSG
jgi:threonine/homoserine/homoserine lactone efflux protein